MKRILAIFTAVAALVASCAKPAQEFVPTTGVNVTPATLVMYPGDYKQVKATITPDNASSRYLLWSSSASAVATVDGWGNITAVAPGSAVISVVSASGNFKGSCEVTVKPIEATSFTLDKTNAVVVLDKSITINATIAPANASYKEITWHSTDPEVASVDDKGVVTGNALGTAMITAKLSTKYAQEWIATCHITVEEPDPTEPETIDLWKNDEAGSKKLYGPGETADKGWIKFADGKVTWEANTSGKPRMATIELKSGSKITVRQVEAKDLAGEYAFFNNAFKALSNTVTEGTRKMKTSVSFSAASEVAALNGHEHNLDLNGLYLEAKVPCSFELTTDGPVIYTYLSKDFQAVTGGFKVAVIPELTNSATYSTGYFAPINFGANNCNYAWVAWNVQDLFTSTPKVTMGTAAQRLVSTDRYFCGFSVVKEGYAEAAYTTIYQLNYNNIWSYSADGGAYFVKK